jgi:cytoskeletal protein RodZ
LTINPWCLIIIEKGYAYMQIKTKKKSKKPLIIVLIIVALIVIAGSIFFFVQSTHQNNSQSAPVTEEEKNNAQTTPSPEKEGETSTPPSDQTSDEVPVNPSASLTITLLDQDNNAVNLNSSLSGVSSNGTCVATFTNPDSRPVVKEFASNGTKGCGPLAVASLEFASIGEWKLNLRFYNQGQQVTAERSISIQ